MTAMFGLFKKTAAFHSVGQISLIALSPLRFPGSNSAKLYLILFYLGMYTITAFGPHALNVRANIYFLAWTSSSVNNRIIFSE